MRTPTHDCARSGARAAKPGHEVDEEIDAMLACNDPFEQYHWFIALAQSYPLEVDQNAYVRLFMIWLRSKAVNARGEKL